MNIIQQVEEQTMQYGSGAKKSIGEFVLQERSRLHNYTIQQIADKTYTSKAALVRFAKGLGFSGWREFCNAFVAEQKYQDEHYSDVDPNFPFKKGSSNKDIINLMCSLQMESLMDTADFMLENPHLDDAVELLRRSNRIVVFGMSPNTLLGELFTRRMLSIGRYVDVPTSDFGLAAGSLRENDCAILISYSGNSWMREPVSVLPHLEKNHVPVIAITSLGDNLLRQHATYTFSMSSRERLYSKISTFSTETSILYILNVLFSCYFARDYDANLDYKVSIASKLEQQRKASLDEMREKGDG